jgi:arginine repressor
MQRLVQKLEEDLRAQDGVISIHTSEGTPHLVVVTYDPDHTKSKEILGVVLGEHLHAELIGL